MEGLMTLMMIILLCLLLCLGSVCLASVLPPKLASGPFNSHESQIKTRLGPELAPKVSPKNHGSVASPPTSHYRSIPHTVTPTSYSPPQKQDCDEISCSDPFTLSPIGSPCGCVFPMQVVVDLGVAPYRLFTQIPDLEVQVAAGTFLKQSQVKIMGANSSIRDQEKTMVTIYLVPLGEKFDSMSALLIYERFWQKKVPIDMSIFGDYEVIYVNYPGLPSSPPSKSGSSSGFGPSGTGSQQYPFTADVPSVTSQKMNSIIVVVIAVSSFILVFICLGVVFIILKWKKLGRLPTAGGSAVTMSVAKRPGIKSITSSSMTSLMSGSLVSTMATCPSSVKLFSLVELEKATEKFSSKKILGEGGFGCVYDGIMEDGSKVAVKLLTKEDKYKDREFIAEVEVLSRLHHRNLVKLIGICIEGRKRCLVYELVANGSVESHLHDAGKGNLDWDARKKIALGAARGLAYLHEDSNPRVIHRDFKASNILLDEDFTPKVSDFGLAREASEGSHHISTRVMGTFGYVAPEYAMTGHLLVKSDVYSYGVVLLELLSGRKPIYISQPEGVENLVTWARPLLNSREGLEQLIDPSLDGSYNLDEVAKVATIASMCVHVETSQRPFMGEVVQALKLIYDSEGSLNSPRESSSGVVDFDFESSWGVPRLTHGYASSFMTMEYDSDPVEQTHWMHSMSCLLGRVESRLYRSGPLSTRTQESLFYRLKGSMSEHGSSLRSQY